MQPDPDKETLEKALVVLEKRTSIRFALLITFFFVLLGMLLEIVTYVVFGKMTVPQAVQAYSWPKLLFLAAVFLPLYYFGIMYKDRKLLHQIKKKLQQLSRS